MGEEAENRSKSSGTGEEKVMGFWILDFGFWILYNLNWRFQPPDICRILIKYYLTPNS